MLKNILNTKSVIINRFYVNIDTKIYKTGKSNSEHQHSMLRDVSNYSRGADTIGAIVGSVCAAHHGLSAFHKDWVEKVRYLTGICLTFAKGIDIADQLTELILAE